MRDLKSTAPRRRVLDLKAAGAVPICTIKREIETKPKADVREKVNI